MAYLTEAIPMTLSDIQGPFLLQTCSNVTFLTALQQLTRFQLNIGHYSMCTRFGVDSSSHFPFRARTNRQTDRRDYTPYPRRRL